MIVRTSEIPLAPNIMETCGFHSIIEDDNHLVDCFLSLGTLAHLNVQLPVS